MIFKLVTNMAFQCRICNIFLDPNSKEKISDETTRMLIFDCIKLIMEKRKGPEFAQEALKWWRTNTLVDNDGNEFDILMVF